MFKKVLTIKENETYKFMIMLFLFSVATFAACYQNIVRSYNSTMLALSYEYGFTSRSLLGTIYHFLNWLLPIDMINYDVVLLFAQICTAAFFIFVMWFCYVCVKNCRVISIKPCEYLMLYMMIFLVSTFSAGYNFFRVDMFMILVSILSAVLLYYEKAEWLVVVLCAIGVMFHQGYVFMYFNIPLVLLAYKFLSSEKKKKWKYGIIFALTFILGSVLFLWFEFFSRSKGASIYDYIVSEAALLAHEGAYHTTLLQHEVLGVDLSYTEEGFHKVNIVQIIMFTIVCIPYLWMMKQFFSSLLKQATDKICKFKYIIVLIGSLTMLPDFLLKIDYGRWVLAVIVYYVVVVLVLAMMHDEGIENALQTTYESVTQKSWSVFLWVYLLLFIPLCDVDINAIAKSLADEINYNFLHFF